jgi:HEAT repeat protein
VSLRPRPRARGGTETRIFLVPVAAYAALPALLAVVVACAKAARSARERSSAARRARIRVLLEAGRPAAALREVRGRARDARDDLAGVFVALRSLTPAYRNAVAGLARDELAEGVVRDVRRRRPIGRAKAALAAARLDLPEAPAAAALLLADRDGEVRSTALRALGLSRHPEAVWLLLRALAGGSVPPERAVERLATPWAVDHLSAAFDRPEFRHVRRWIVTALDLAGAGAAQWLALRLLASSDAEDRVHACRALGHTRAEAAVQPLLDALRDGEWTVRAQAARALGSIGDERAVRPLAAALADESWWVRSNSAAALRSIGEEGLRALRDALDTNDRYARDRAAEALALEQVEQRRAAAGAT